MGYALTQGLQAGGNILGNAIQGYGQWQGAKAAGKQINTSMGENTAFANNIRNEQSALQQPFISTGVNALNDLSQFRMSDPGSYTRSEFGGVNMNEDPGVAYRMDQGRRTLDASAANKGNLFSGAQQKALLTLGQNLGSQEYGNAYARQYGQYSDTQNANQNQFNTEADRQMNLDNYRMNQLQNLTNVGQNATNTLGSANLNIGNNQWQNQQFLRGQLADVNATRASAPYMAAGAGVKTLGNAGGNISSYYMNR